MTAPEPAASPTRSDYLVLAALVLAGLCLRAWKLGHWPSPAGDEAGWFLMGIKAVNGDAVVLPPDAAFVPPTYAKILGGSFWLFGSSFTTARIPQAVGIVALGAAAALWAFRRGQVRLGLCAAAVACLHPWAVAWSRTAAVPYAFAFGLALAGPLAWWAAADIAKPWLRALALVAAGQMMALGLHFSPLCGLTLAGCGLAMLVGRHRALLQTAGPWLALLGVAVHLWPLIAGALQVAARPGGTAADSPLADFGARLTALMAHLGDGLSGGATLRHMALGQCAAGAWPQPVGRAAVAAALGWAAWRARTTEDGRRALLLLGVAVVGLPLLLLPARTWWLPTIDAERYSFIVLAPAALVFGCALQSAGRPRAAAGLVAVPVAAALAALIFHATHTSRPDCGLYAQDGGGWRGVRALRSANGGIIGQPQAIAAAAQQVAAAHGQPATALLHDFFGQQAITAILIQQPERQVDFAWARDGQIGPQLHGKLVVVPLWAAGALAASFTPVEVAEAGRAMRHSVEKRLLNPRLEAQLPGADGLPLVELWSGTVP